MEIYIPQKRTTQWQFFDIIETDANTIWAATARGLLRITDDSIFDIFTLASVSFSEVVLNGSASNRATESSAIITLKVSTRLQLHFLDVAMPAHDRPFEVYKLLPDHAGNIWLSFRNGTILRHNPEKNTWRLFDEREDLRSDIKPFVDGIPNRRNSQVRGLYLRR